MKTIECANCAKHMGEFEKARLRKDLKYICQKCLDKLFNASMPRRTDNGFKSSFDDIFKGFK